MSKFSAAAPLLLFALMGCSNQPDKTTDANTLTANDFENLIGWTGDMPGLNTLSKVKAHSGVYSTSVRPGADYSLGYNATLGSLLSSRPSKLTISAWVLLPNNRVNPKLVVEIKDPDNPKDAFYQALELNKAVTSFNKWERVAQTITLPPTATANSKLLVYMWRADSPEPVYLDDMQISQGQ